MPTFIDMLGRTVEIPNYTPQRIVSLVPSITETIADLVGIDSLVGVTNYCVHPQEVRTQTKIIGGTKNVKIQEILALKPDIVIANKEENYQEIVIALEGSIPVFVTDINNTDDALDMILQLGEILDCTHKSISIVSHIQQLISNLPIVNDSM
jgi:ABC-type Fe3+-hydroxamate transport system substrate-binding protein